MSDVPSRPLTEWEAATVARLLESPGGDPLHREAWRRQIPSLRVVWRCDCSPQCPQVGFVLLDDMLRVPPLDASYGVSWEGYLPADDRAAVWAGEAYAAVEEYLLFQKAGSLACLDAHSPNGGPADRRPAPERIRFWQDYERDTSPVIRE